MRIIDADALKEKIIDLLEIEWGYEGIREDVSRIIDSMPATEERPHGEWKYESYGQYLSTYKCSNCGFHGYKHWICCPNCGADMREGEEK